MTTAQGFLILLAMHEEDFAIVRSLVSVAWADGHFAEQEKEMLTALLDAYQATEGEKTTLLEYAKEKRTLDDIPVQDLSADDRRILLHHATLLTFADGKQNAVESEFLEQLATKLRVPSDEAKNVLAQATDHAKKNLNLL